MRKFRASLEPFWDLKIGKYVEYLTPVSSEYLISCELLSLTSTAGRTSRVFLAYVIPWINKASLVLYIAHIAQRATADATDLKFGSGSAPSSSSLWWVKHRSLSLSRSRVDLRYDWAMRRQHAALCTHYIDDLLPHAPLPLCSYWGHGQVFIS